MPVKIRLMRMGKKKQPSYRVVVADDRSPRDGRFLEILGTYAPRDEPSTVDIDADRAVAWLHKGARPTETAHRLLADAGIWARFETERGKPAKPPTPPRVTTPKGAAMPKAKTEAAAAPEPEPTTGEPAAGDEPVPAEEASDG